MTSESRKNIVYEEQQKERQRSVFDLPHDFFDSCRLFHDGSVLTSPEPSETSPTAIDEELHSEEQQETNKKLFVPRWSCNICKAEFESLEDQRSHFKSDFHRFNVKLSIIGKDSIKEDAFDESTSDSFFKDNDISSISGSEDENDKVSSLYDDLHKKARESAKSKVSVCLKTGEVVSFWKCLLMNECENVSYENDKLVTEESVGRISYLREKEVVDRLKSLVHETREKKKLRIMLLASGGHFAGCVFDGNSVVAHKTFHRYVVRARAGKKQSSKDASGKAASSAGASLRRYNELSLKKEIQELLAAWKPYFDLSSSIFIHAPSNNRQLLYNGDTPYFSNPHCVIRHMPFTIRRPTFKEAKRIYNNLTNMVYEVVGKGSQSSLNGETLISRNGDSPTGVGIGVSGSLESNPENSGDTQANVAIAEVFQLIEGSQMPCESEILSKTTALHEAAMSGNSVQTLELLEEGLDPCIKDERGRTPYMLATDKEVRNTFRRFMALNLDKWDWDIAKVPSPLTKEMEESQAVKQAEKDAKRKAKAKELKKLRKAKEKKAQAEAALKEKALKEKGAASTSFPLMQARPKGVLLSKEEELKRAQAAEREKRAAAAEKRIAAAAALNSERMSTSAATSSPESQSGGNDINCSCCNVSLAGKVPFHRYNYKYCSTSCMHVHRELLEDE